MPLISTFKWSTPSRELFFNQSLYSYEQGFPLYYRLEITFYQLEHNAFWHVFSGSVRSMSIDDNTPEVDKQRTANSTAAMTTLTRPEHHVPVPITAESSDHEEDKIEIIANNHEGRTISSWGRVQRTGFGRAGVVRGRQRYFQ